MLPFPPIHSQFCFVPSYFLGCHLAAWGVGAWHGLNLSLVLHQVFSSHFLFPMSWKCFQLVAICACQYTYFESPVKQNLAGFLLLSAGSSMALSLEQSLAWPSAHEQPEDGVEPNLSTLSTTQHPSKVTDEPSVREQPGKGLDPGSWMVSGQQRHSKVIDEPSDEEYVPARLPLKRQRIPHPAVYRENLNAHLDRLRDNVPSFGIKSVVDATNEDGFPQDAEEKEQYFTKEVARGETMCTDGSDPVEAALCFYKALKVYPQPEELIGIYDKTVPKVS